MVGVEGKDRDTALALAGDLQEQSLSINNYLQASKLNMLAVIVTSEHYC